MQRGRFHFWLDAHSHSCPLFICTSWQALAQLLHKETKLLQTIDRLKVRGVTLCVVCGVCGEVRRTAAPSLIMRCLSWCWTHFCSLLPTVITRTSACERCWICWDGPSCGRHPRGLSLQCTHPSPPAPRSLLTCAMVRDRFVAQVVWVTGWVGGWVGEWVSGRPGSAVIGRGHDLCR